MDEEQLWVSVKKKVCSTMYTPDDRFEGLKKGLRKYIEDTPKQFKKRAYIAFIPANRHKDFVDYVEWLAKDMNIDANVCLPIPLGDEYKVEVDFDLRSPEEKEQLEKEQLEEERKLYNEIVVNTVIFEKDV